MRKIVTFSFMFALLAANGLFATTTYYSQGSVAVNTLSNWNTIRGGGGSNPTVLNGGDIFVIQNGHSMTTSAAWTVSGTGNKIQIESGGTLTATFVVAAVALQVDNGGTYVHNVASTSFADVPGSAGNRTFGATSTFELKNWSASSTTINCPTTTSFGNLLLTVNFGATTTFAGNLQSVQGDLTIQTGSTNQVALITNSPTGTTITISGSIIVKSGIFVITRGTANPTVNVGGNIDVQGGTMFGAGTGSGSIFTLNVTGDWKVTGGIFTLSSSSITSGNTLSINVGGNFNFSAGTFNFKNLASGAFGNITFTGGSSSSVTFTVAASGVTWSNNAGATFVVANGKTVTVSTNNFTVPANTTFTVNVGGILATNVQFSGVTTNINGSFQLNSGGWATGTNFTYGAAGTLIFNATYTANSGTYWPTSSGPVNVTVTSAGVLTLGFARTVTGTFQTSSGVVNSTASNLTISGGTFQINSGGYINTNAVVYSGTATLVYNNGGTYTTTDYEFPASGGPNKLTIQNNSIVTMHAARTLAGATTIASGSILGSAGATFTANGAVAVNGSFQLNQNGWATGSGTWTYGSGGTLIFNNNSGSYGVNSTDVFWPSSSGPVNVTVQNGGGMTLNAARTVSGTVQASCNIANANNLTINGTLKLLNINSCTGAPTYGSSSTLWYYYNGTFPRNDEWKTTAPANVTLGNNTILNYPNTSNTAAQTITGSLTIDAGSAFYMDYGSVGVGLLTVGGNVVQNGALSLGFVAGGDLAIKGNYTRTGTLQTNGRMIEFNGTSAQQLTGTTTFDYLKVNNSTGLTLNNSITVNGTLWVTSGDMTTGANSVTLGGSATLSETAGNLVFGTITTTRTAAQNSNNTFGGIGVEINAAGAAPGSTVVTRTTGVQQVGSGNVSIKRYYDIIPTTNTGLNATLVFHYDGRVAELNGVTESSLQLFKSTDAGSTWSLGVGTVNTTAKTVTYSGITDFSRWTAAGSSAPLPVELNTLVSEVEGRNVRLNWSTATEINSYKFIVERTISGANTWIALGEVRANNYSNAPKYYNYTDKNVSSGKFTYRLKMVDNDGTFEYSRITTEAFIGVPAEFSLSQNYPNPFNPTTKITYALPVSSHVTLELYTITGQKVATILNGNAEAGYYDVPVNMSGYNLSSGVYLYKFSGKELNSGKQFTSVKKMMFLK